MQVFWRFFAIMCFACFVSLGIIYANGGLTTAMYKGRITEMYKQPGYRGDVDNHVVFYSDSIKRNIDITVSDNDYVNLVVGQPISIRLSNSDLK